ncbi:nuclear transport factor 2 family protein [Sphaerisporangium album]|uniref:Nuclear transport factor 2 family protein n=1 Tax=Sphaerisporangium album TaxID=509200 RepID=A0A367EUV0_9ACTN|nr:nuclear transport factor 2 family protein [Sphaerisporangium album]RCG21894.1 nuclear transport factor 2 family protein [Sphaerisporangium album]
MDTREAAERFARTWQSGWAAHDAGLIGTLFAEGCVHRSMPFRPVHRGRVEVLDYIRWSFASERATDVRFGVPIVDGDRAFVEYRVFLVESEGDKPVTLAGCAVVRFGEDGLAVEVRDYWHVADGHQDPQGDLFL